MRQGLLCSTGQFKTHHLPAYPLLGWCDRHIPHIPDADAIYTLSYTTYHVTKIEEFQSIHLLLSEHSDNMLKL